MYINAIHHKKIEQKIPSTTLILKYICKISFTYDKYYFVTYTLHKFKFLRFCCLKNKLINLCLKLIKYTFKKQKKSNM